MATLATAGPAAMCGGGCGAYYGAQPRVAAQHLSDIQALIDLLAHRCTRALKEMESENEWLRQLVVSGAAMAPGTYMGSGAGAGDLLGGPVGPPPGLGKLDKLDKPESKQVPFPLFAAECSNGPQHVSAPATPLCGGKADAAEGCRDLAARKRDWRPIEVAYVGKWEPAGQIPNKAVPKPPSSASSFLSEARTDALVSSLRSTGPDPWPHAAPPVVTTAAGGCGDKALDAHGVRVGNLRGQMPPWLIRDPDGAQHPKCCPSAQPELAADPIYDECDMASDDGGEGLEIGAAVMAKCRGEWHPGVVKKILKGKACVVQWDHNRKTAVFDIDKLQEPRAFYANQGSQEDNETPTA